MDNFYRENILDHYKNPRNFGRLKNPDFSFKEENLMCGDMIGMEIKLKNKNGEPGTINKVRFYGEGCAISMASASMLTEKIQGRKVKEVKKLGSKDILKMLGICPTPTRLKCALLPLEVLQKALSAFAPPSGGASADFAPPSLKIEKV